jgi:hypothetical protein
VRDKVSQTYKTTGKTIVLCILIFTFLDSRLLMNLELWKSTYRGLLVKHQNEILTKTDSDIQN